MKRADVGALIVLVLLAIVAALFAKEPIGLTFMDPLQPVRDDEAADAVRKLCMASRLNSFGEDCLGISWQFVAGSPVDLRSAPTPIRDETPFLRLNEMAPTIEVIRIDNNGQIVYG